MFYVRKFTRPLLAGAALALAAASPVRAADKPLPEWRDYMAELRAAGEAGIGGVYKSGNAQDRQDAWNILFGQIARGFVADIVNAEGVVLAHGSGLLDIEQFVVGLHGVEEADALEIHAEAVDDRLLLEQSSVRLGS